MTLKLYSFVFRFLLLLTGLLHYSEIRAQSYSLSLSLHPFENILLKRIKLPDKYEDSLFVVYKVNEVLQFARENGYLLAETSSFTWHNKVASVVITLNEPYKLAAISNGNIHPEMLQIAGFSESLFSNTRYNPRQLDELCTKILSAYENNGYPFASVFLDSVDIQQSNISLKLYCSPGLRVQMDSLTVIGDLKISRKFLESFLDLKAGSIYNASTLKNLEKRLNELSFLQSAQAPKLTFYADKARLNLVLEKRNASQFEGILGFLPDNNTGKLQLTGDLNLHLKNAFRSGESLGFSFKGLPGKSRELNLHTNLAELFSTRMGIGLSFNLFKQDSSFQNVDARAGINYRIKKGYLNFFVSTRSGSPIVSTQVNEVELPSYASLKVVSYGVGWMYNTLNSSVPSSRGIFIQLNAEAGRKKIATSSIPQEIVDRFQLRSSQYRVESTAQVYFPLSKRGVLKLGNQTGLLLGKDFFENELYRVGGFSTLRGFDEQSILATNFSVFSSEYRFMIEKQSFLFAFINQGLINYHTIKISSNDKPQGVGAGISLETRAGMFSLAYALGKQKDNPLNLQRGKIHFGLTTLF